MRKTAFSTRQLARSLAGLACAVLLAAPASAASTLEVTGTTAHCGNFGLAVSMDGSSAAWVETDHPSADVRYVVRFYMKLDYATPASTLHVFSAFKGADGVDLTTPVIIVTLDAAKNLGLQYRTNAGLQTAGGTHAMGAGWHAIEIDWQTGAGTGYVTTMIDNVVDAGLGASSLSNDTATVDFARWGAVGGTLTGTGFLMLDDFVSQRTSPIGLVPDCGTNNALSPENMKFYPVTPCRAYYTGWPGNTAGVGGVERVIDIRDNRIENQNCGALIPADAKALAINFTAASPTSNGNFKVYPNGIGAPTATTMNFLQNVNRANNALVMVGAGVTLKVLPFTTTPSAQVGYIIDIAGYFKKP